MSSFPGQILFLSTLDGHKPEVVVNSNTLDVSQSIEAVANILRTDTMEHYKNLPEINLPPTVEELNSHARKLPESVTLLTRHADMDVVPRSLLVTLTLWSSF